MLRKIIGRAVLLLTLTLFSLIGLWLTLPSPSSLVDSDNGAYQQSVLRSGKVLTTVHPNHGSSDRYAIALDWQLIPDYNHDSLTLRINSFEPINLTDIAGPDRLPYSARYSGEVKAGDLDGVNAPWFSSADATLLFWEVHREMQSLDISVLVQEPGVVEIWPQSPSSSCEENCVYGTLVDGLRPNSPGREALCTLSGIPLEGQRTDTSQVLVTGMVDRTPSKTFPVRRAIIRILKPLAYNVGAPLVQNVLAPLWTIIIIPAMFIVQAALFLSVCILCVTGIVGLQRRLMYNQPFRRTWPFSIMTQKRSKVVWGPSGPLQSTDHDYDEDEEPQRRGPTPLSRPLDLWKSKSPLDDLLATFKVTAWMTQPIGQKRQSRGQTWTLYERKD